MKKNELPSIGVLILNRNGREWLTPLYHSLLAQDYKNARLYLVDNASEDDSVELTLEHYPAVKVIRMPRNLGYCMAYNLSMPYAFADGCEWVIWANNDILLEPGCLEQLATAAQSDLKIGVVGPAFLEWESQKPNYYMLGNHPASVTAMQKHSQEPIDTEWVEGSFLMASRACIESVGPLDPYLFFYWEETDFCRRARFNDWRVVLAPAALARHYAGGWSEANQENRLTANRLQSRNYYIYKLANPFSGFMSNLLDATHLLAVNAKQCLINKPSLTLFHLQIFANILANLPTLYRKWARDRMGEHPPVLQEGMSAMEPEIIISRSVSHSTCTSQWT